VVAFAASQARAAREAVAAADAVPAPRPTHWTFWLAWCLLGLGVGLAVRAWQLAHAAVGG
jgi:hypothetical protein